MSKVHAVLLVPHEDGTYGLLEEGPCGARPPMAYQETGTRIWRPFCGALGENHPESNDALVFAWNGEPVWQGAVWVEGVLAALDCDETPSWRLLVNRVSRALVERRPAAVNMLRRLVGDLGTLLLLDAEGREVSDD